jgi:hypothetical protein
MVYHKHSTSISADSQRRLLLRYWGTEKKAALAPDQPKGEIAVIRMEWQRDKEPTVKPAHALLIASEEQEYMLVTETAQAASAIVGEWQAPLVPFDVVVMTAGGEEARISVCDATTVQHAKELVAKQMGQAAYLQQLYWREEELMNTKMLCECGVSAGTEEGVTTLYLVVLVGGE